MDSPKKSDQTITSLFKRPSHAENSINEFEFRIIKMAESDSSKEFVGSLLKPADRQIPQWELWFLRLVRVIVFFKSLPFTKVRSDRKMGVVKSRFWFLVWYFRLICLTLDTIYLLWVSKTVKLEIVREKEFLDFWLHTLSRLVASLVVWAIALGLKGTVQLHNTLTATQEIWRDRFGVYGSHFSGALEKRLGQTIRFGTVYAFFQALSPVILHLTGRQTARYWGSRFLPQSSYNSLPGVVLFAAYDFSNSLISIHNAIYPIGLMVACFVLMNYWTNDLRVKVLQYGNMSGIPLKQYRILLCLSSFINHEVGLRIFPTLTTTGSLMVCVALCALITNMSGLTAGMVLALATGLPLIIIALYFIYSGGGAVSSGSQRLKSLLERKSDILRVKQIRSLRSIRLCLGGCYYINKEGFLDHIQWIVEHTIDIILV